MRYPHLYTQTANRVLLESQRDRLRGAMAAYPQASVFAHNLAARYLLKVKSALNATDIGLEANKGLFGRNGWAPGVEDAIRSLKVQHELTVTPKRDATAAKRMADAA